MAVEHEKLIVRPQRELVGEAQARGRGVDRRSGNRMQSEQQPFSWGMAAQEETLPNKAMKTLPLALCVCKQREKPFCKHREGHAGTGCTSPAQPRPD